jgi:hypothetical protein
MNEIDVSLFPAAGRACGGGVLDRIYKINRISERQIRQELHEEHERKSRIGPHVLHVTLV